LFSLAIDILFNTLYIQVSLVALLNFKSLSYGKDLGMEGELAASLLE
jgi:hypothetical protein